MSDLLNYVSRDAFGLAYVLLLSFLIGVVRESSYQNHAIKFGGVRTYPLIGLFGYIAYLIDKERLAFFIVGALIIGAIIALFYYYHIKKDRSGFISEITALITYLIGGLAARGEIWAPLAITILMILIVQSRTYLENFARTIPPEEVTTFVKFMLLSAVILPVVPNQDFTEVGLNPFKIWLFVVAVNGLSYVSYLLQIFFKGRGGVFLFSVLGGAYSSTITTIVLAKRARELAADATGAIARHYAGIVLASSMMYLRMLALVGFFSYATFSGLMVPLLAAAACGIGLAAVVYVRSLRRDEGPDAAAAGAEPGGGSSIRSHANPLDLESALVFAVLFVIVKTASHFAILHVGTSGFYALSFVMGFTDVDPFILSVVQSPHEIATHMAVFAIILAAMSNNLLKGLYAYLFTRSAMGLHSLITLFVMSLMSIAAYALMARW
ncbi:MAG TPA: MgtC/SapB family protein [Spirochaetota bacterium]|nr:MgtC/SapB family protein [Spirochaetota bacterium]HNT11934.1 MgtC/SapB family protein [Spirochaetota bacterium]